MDVLKTIALLAMYLSICNTRLAWCLPAFPGAQGMGASATGARGNVTQSVCKVTNLNDSGAGSLRACIEGAGHDGAFVVFETSGTINLSTNISMLSNYITIAGETSPGGIAIAGREVDIGSSGTYNMHDIIIRHMRFRMGSHQCAPNCDTDHAFQIWKSHDIILDHCSFSWGIDETVGVTTYDNASVYDITFSWCMITEGLRDPAPEVNHGYGLLLNANYSSDPQNTMTMHHCYFAHHQDRSPRASGSVFMDLRNNVIYNWESSLNTNINVTDGVTQNLNFVGNYTKPGPDSNACDPTGNSFEMHLREGGQASSCPDAVNPTPYALVYMQGNLGCVRDDPADPEWAIGCGYSGDLLSTSWRAANAFSTTDIAVTTATMSYAYAQQILQTVGATKPVRDSYDAEMVTEFTNGTGGIKADTTWPDDWPTFSSPSAPADTDSDGMSDSWETIEYGGLAQTYNGDYDSDGYMNIEEFFFYLAGDQDGGTPASGNVITGGGSGTIIGGGAGVVTAE